MELRRRAWLRGVGGFAALGVALRARAAHALGASTAQRAAILARALSYERSLPERAGDEVNLLLVRGEDAASAAAASEWLAAFESLSGVRVDGRPLVAKIASVGDDLPELFSRGNVDVTVACGPVGAALTDTISTLTRGTKSLSVGTERAQVESGLTLGIIEEGDKVRILVNLRAAKREGIRFSAKLLKLAEILR